MAEDRSEKIEAPRNLPESSDEILQLGNEVDGFHQGIHFVTNLAKSRGGFDRDALLKLNEIVRNDFLNPHLAGLRSVLVRVGSTIKGEYCQASFEPADLCFLSEYFNEFASEFDEKTREISASNSVEDVVEIASWGHLRLNEIHPFRDGNGRTARLLVDFVL